MKGVPWRAALYALVAVVIANRIAQVSAITGRGRALNHHPCSAVMMAARSFDSCTRSSRLALRSAMIWSAAALDRKSVV